MSKTSVIRGSENLSSQQDAAETGAKISLPKILIFGLVIGGICMGGLSLKKNLSLKTKNGKTNLKFKGITLIKPNTENHSDELIGKKIETPVQKKTPAVNSEDKCGKSAD